MKCLKIRVFNWKRPPFHVWIRPGIRPGDVFIHLNIFEYVLVPAATSAEALPIEICKNNNTFDEDWYERVQDGDELITIPAIEAARIVYAYMMSKASPKETIQ